jgi:hypothetical protein
LRILLKTNLKRVPGYGMQVGLSILRNQSKTGSALDNITSQSYPLIISQNNKGTNGSATASGDERKAARAATCSTGEIAR